MKNNSKKLVDAIEKVNCDGFKYFDLSRDLKLNKTIIAYALRNLLLQFEMFFLINLIFTRLYI